MNGAQRQLTGRHVRRRAARDLLWAVALLQTWLVVQFVAGAGYGLGVDSHAYWAAWRGEMYDAAPATLDAYLYSPAFAQLVWPLAQLPWPVFGVVWAIATVAAVIWLVKVAHWYVAVPLSLIGLHEVLTGNINWLLALVVVLGQRHPALWSLPFLTKVTSCLGPIWFLARGEWRKLLVCLGTIVGIALASWLVVPELWRDWISFLRIHSGSTDTQVGAAFLPPLIVRLPIAIALVAWGARRDHWWTLAVGMMLSSPVAGLGQMALFLALPRLNAEARRRRTAIDS
ncbi:glycosyltransferase family 87 protein [Nocardioides hwasunensis]|uniref:DUF2029 domain-containing protein n=1 Tax=Nocardioides hwasunensis TaxID=397258 RepID=A0ABR8MC01_9ACTN|nr:glycosyltransferase family 87 protein [Nocardioides hwasunensis]MBD3913383.1 DUF2029 domain-containing protein [Nocardioides hwasunensis]